ncbi:LAFA_0A02036g1_1 [Lachancea sp. 'fantastica']|nr:LAFA_0A02036g1_1 [Lachancea sp. 'fantastica']
MSQNQDSSADTSGSSGSTDGQIWLTGQEAPTKPDSYFKESFEPSTDSGAPSLSVYVDYARFSDLGDSSDHSEDNHEHSEHSEIFVQEPPTTSTHGTSRGIAMKVSRQVLQSPGFPVRLRNQSTDTVSTDFLDASDKSSGTRSRVLSGDSSNRGSGNNDSWGNDLPLRRLKHMPPDLDRDSRRTISTSLLEADSIRRSSNISRPDARSSSHYGEDNAANIDLSTPIVPVYHEIIEASDEESDKSHEKGSNPSIEEAVRLFRQEASFVPIAQLTDPRTATAPSSTVSKKPSQSSLQSHVSDRTSQYSQTRKARRGPRHSSLLTSILVAPHQKPEKPQAVIGRTPQTIPALRKPSASTHNPRRDKSKVREGQAVLQKEVGPDPEKVANPYRDTHDGSLQQIYQYRDALAGKDPEKHQGSGQYNDTPSESSFQSSAGRYKHMFSVWRILCVLLVCALMPPLYFIIGIGPLRCLPDKKLMKMIMNEQYRKGIAGGFIWNVNLRWFRNLCLFLGILEILIILACIGIGFGVGLSRQ